MRAAIALLVSIVLGACSRGMRPDADDAPPGRATRRIVVTIDDLPWAGLGIRSATAPVHMASHHARLVAALKAAKAPVVGFVNEGKLEGENGLVPARVDMLHDWLDAGAELGNHTYSHVDLHAVGLARYGQDILDGERVTRALLQERGTAPRWFRHPYLRAGRTAQDKAALAEFLAQHGYRIAPVTVDNSDWIWARAFRTVLEGKGDAGTREPTLERLRRDYVQYMIAKLSYYEAQSRELLGYELPQVLLLHANELNAESYGALIAAIRARGYRFVKLEEALRDPAYARIDGYHGAYGPSWLHRWAIADQRPKEFFAGEPATPDWVMKLAGVESE